ncbi:hypothetical protein AN958_01313 [Leucoagaricus sp. SymC.cos]|nr:hypothetical protein AN958_01313 [Leucoagaricus sp. SymC.cos]
MPNTRYYQLGGFRPDVRWFEQDWNDKRLVDLLAGESSPMQASIDRPLELVLGIKRTGSSHLLLADIKANIFQRRFPRTFSTLVDYTSVSPIFFDSPQALEKKLGTLKPKARKGKKDDARDTSQANKAFLIGEQGLGRGEFERGRLLYHILQNTINSKVYSVADTNWTHGLRLMSFTFNVKTLDQRSYEEKQQSPEPLDYGWAEVTDVLSTRVSFKPGSFQHLVCAKDRLLQPQHRTRANFEHGTTRTIPLEEIELLARQFFTTVAERNDVPTILLVHDEGLTRNVLRGLNIDTSEWESGIGQLLWPQATATSSMTSNARPSSSNLDYERRKHRARDRSQSPIRSTRAGFDGFARRSRKSPPSPSRFAPVYIVDVQALYKSMMKFLSDKHIGDIAHELGVLENGKTWCAGNEAVYIFDAWRAMVSGAAIDEQHTSRTALVVGGGTTQGVQGATNQLGSPPVEDSDEEFDPNNIVQKTEGNDDGSDTDYESDY